MSQGKLEGKRVLVTGSSAGLGEAIATMLAKEGATIFIHGRNAARANQVADAIRRDGGIAEVALGDLSTEAGADEVATACLAGGPIDILVNNAGAYAHTGWMDTTPEEWQATFNLNVVSYIRMIRRFVPGMKKKGWGRIVNIGGGLGIQPLAGEPALRRLKSTRLKNWYRMTAAGLDDRKRSPPPYCTWLARTLIISAEHSFEWTVAPSSLFEKSPPGNPREGISLILRKN